MTRPQTEIMRGVAIVLIILHNLFHSFPTILKESEFYFNATLIKRFFKILSEGSPTFSYDVISFLGWYGVPVFVFLSGYGLVRRYGVSNPGVSGIPSFDATSFLKRNWLKLLKLMSLGVLIFLVEELINCRMAGRPINSDTIIGILLPLTLLNDLVQFRFDTIPGVYWYFGLTFELYIIYAYMVNGKSQKYLWMLTAFCYFLFIFFSLDSGRESVRIAEYIRHNFLGWMLPFAFGVMTGRCNRINVYALIAISIASLFFFFASLRSVWLWQLSGIFAVIVIIGVSMLFSIIPYWSRMWIWIGKLSAYIFVCHPIVRHLLGRYIFDIFTPGSHPTIPIILTYTVSILAGALIYRLIVRKIK